MSTDAGANYTGSILEKFIDDRLKERKYAFIERGKFTAATYLKQSIYTKQFPIGKSIYGTQQLCDFLLFHPVKHTQCLVIESKWQQSGGSVDEKFPYLVENIKLYAYPTILLLDGDGYKKEAEAWIRRQVGGNFLQVLNMKEFNIWVNKGNL
jgi:site-specific DNA-adenine methylase